MGGSGGTSAQHRAYGEGASGKFPSGKRMGTVYRCNHSGSQPAQSKIPMLTNPKHLILKAPHPSPLSAYRGFFGCRHFSQANAFLERNGIAPIDWQIEDV